MDITIYKIKSFFNKLIDYISINKSSSFFKKLFVKILLLILTILMIPIKIIRNIGLFFKNSIDDVKELIIIFISIIKY